MKRAIMSLMLASLLLMSACTTRNQYGDCIGLMDQPVPGVKYELSWWNGFVAFIFSGTIVVPIYTVGADIKCPVQK